MAEGKSYIQFIHQKYQALFLTFEFPVILDQYCWLSLIILVNKPLLHF